MRKYILYRIYTRDIAYIPWHSHDLMGADLYDFFSFSLFKFALIFCCLHFLFANFVARICFAYNTVASASALNFHTFFRNIFRTRRA